MGIVCYQGGFCKSDINVVIDFIVQFDDSSTTKNFFFNPTLSAIALSNSRDTINPLPIPRLIPMKTTIMVTVTNSIANVPMECYMTLRGYKLYKKKGRDSILRRYAVESNAVDGNME